VSKAAKWILMLILAVVVSIASAVRVMPEDIKAVNASGLIAAGTSTAYPYSPDDNIIVNNTQLNLYAQRIQFTDTYKVTYDANGGTGGYFINGILPGATETVYAPDKIDIASSIVGLVFDGWNESSDGNGTQYEPGQGIIVNSDITLYAQWKHDGTTWYKVNYHPNGGMGNYISVYLAAGRSHSIMTNAAANISRTGYSFTGWNMEADGSGVGYKPLEKIIIKGDMTLYAQYAEGI